jgi:hypothetical protein
MMGDRTGSPMADKDWMPLRAIRVPDKTWKLAQERAKAEGTNVSAVVRDALERYGEQGKEDR